MARILVVDDRALNREYLVTLLTSAGHTVEEAGDGRDALARVRATLPDLVISDILMPAMDGYEFVRQIRSDPASADTRVIFCTAHYLEREAQRLARECGVTRVLSKPMEPETVLRAVDEVLGHSAPPAPDSRPGPLSDEFDREHLRLMTDKLSAQAEELQCVNSRLEALIDASCSLASNREPVSLISEYCRMARELCAARYSAVGIGEQDRESLRHFITSGFSAETNLGQPRLRESVFAAVMNDSLPVRLQVTERTAGALGLPANHPPVRSLLVVPLISGHRVCGFLYLAQRVGADQFDEADQKVATSLAAQLSIFYENARLFDELQRKAAELEANIRKNAELEQQFLQAQKMEAVGRLAGGVAHDFNKMLTLILGYCRMLIEESHLGPSGQEAADEILKAADRASALTNQLLAFSRSQILQPKLLNLNDCIRTITNMLHRLIGEDIQLIPKLAPDLGLVKADPGQIDQILMNLAVNARDAMPHGGKIIVETGNVSLKGLTLAADLHAKTGEYVLLTVTDTGQGLDERVRSRLFEPFFTTKERGKGTGLGLSTVYGIVKQSGGNIWVESELGKGTTFKIYLPQTIERPVTAGAAYEAPAPRKQSGKILVLEDDPS